MSTFTEHWRTKQGAEAQPLNDAIYRKELKARTITRPQDDEDPSFELDRCLGVDVTLTIPGGMTIRVQEKTLSNEYASYNTICVEYMQNPKTQERGDWFNLGADCYFVGYLSEDKTDYQSWCLLNWTAVKLAHCRYSNRPLWSESQNTRDGARASFKFVECNKLYAVCPEAFIAQSGMLSPSNTIDLVTRQVRAVCGDSDFFDEFCETHKK